MTDQPEPKYKIGDWVQLNSDIVTEIESIVTEPDDDGPFYYISFGGGESIPESDIKCAVAIHPIKHHKCKDCEHTTRDERFKDKPFPTCETCDKWKTVKCLVAPYEANGEFIRKQKENPRLIDWTDKDFFCANHSDFGDNNGKDM